MQFESMMKIVVLDPALIAKGGHHTGFALMAAKSYQNLREVFDFEVVCHKSVDLSIVDELESYGCNVRTEFFLNFYELFEQPVRLMEAQEYIREAAREYASAIKMTEERYPSQKLVFFHPSLSWEHAIALALALSLLRSEDKFQSMRHIVCAMFNPGMAYGGFTTDSTNKLQFKLGFAALIKEPNVELFASDSELAEKYTELLDVSSPLPIHPCYLADWDHLVGWEKNNTGSNHSKAAEVVLYMGDAKREKGFLELPDLLCNLLPHLNSDQDLYIQFTVPWEDVELEAAARRLVEIANSDSRLKVDRKFLSDEELHQKLSSASTFVFNYCPVTYANKSSGFLWIVAWHGLKILTLSESWLSRESARLAHQAQNCRGSTRALICCLNSLGNDKSDQINSVNSYRSQLYRSFWTWIRSVADFPRCQSTVTHKN